MKQFFLKDLILIATNKIMTFAQRMILMEEQKNNKKTLQKKKWISQI